MRNKFLIHTDGGARGNPGPAGAGWLIRGGSGEILKKDSAYLGEQTNNWAEYEAVIRALKDLKKVVPKKERKEAKIELRLDSELIAKQLNGEYQVKEEPLQMQYMKVHNMRVSDFPNLSVVHVPREENSEADELANIAMDSGLKNIL